VLLFDEVDSLLFERGMAEKTWEISQVNEMLTWMDHHPLPFIAATNHAQRLDGAALRRFVFKVKLEPLGPAAAARAFETFFQRPAPPRVAEIAGLTPGDFAVVARQLRFRQETADDDAIVDLLAAEAAAKPGLPRRIGFCPASATGS
jgi:SpoVK/Ycf46/Vps4 family AAA+-type ATPase